MIIVLAEMRKEQSCDCRVHVPSNEVGHHIIRKMTLAAHHTLLHRPGIWPDFQHLDIVIRFQHQQIGAAQVELDRIGQIPEIGEDADLDALRAKAEAHRIDGIVRHCEAVDIDVADLKSGSSLEAVELRRVLAPGDRGRSEASHENWNVELPGERDETADMIGMLVCDQNCVDFFRLLVDGGQSGKYIPLAQTCVDEDARAAGANESRIARAAAGEHTNLNDNAPPLLIVTESITMKVP